MRVSHQRVLPMGRGCCLPMPRPGQDLTWQLQSTSELPHVFAAPRASSRRVAREGAAVSGRTQRSPC